MSKVVFCFSRRWALVLVTLLAWIPLAKCFRYRYMSYGAINARLRLLARMHPDILSVYTAADHFELPQMVRCRTALSKSVAQQPDSECDILVAAVGKPGMPAVLILGSLHGDERLGSLAAYYLVQTLVQYSKQPRKDEWISRLVRTRQVIVVALPNPVGYDRFGRYEEGSNSTLIDVAEDFPFARGKQGTCFKSVAARAINALFDRYLFRIAIALHGKNEFVGYSWGSDRREFCAFPPSNASRVRSSLGSSTLEKETESQISAVSKFQLSLRRASANPGEDYDDNDPECVSGWVSPDNAMLEQIASKMAVFAGPLDSGKLYKTGSLNNPSIAGPVGGGFADYAYASSFREDLLSTCSGSYDLPTNVSHRAATFVFETNKLATPPERQLGFEHNLYKMNGEVIPRLLRPLLLAIDLAKPYVFFTASRQPRVGRGGILRVQWSVGGALTVDRTYLVITVGTDGKPFFSANQSGSSMWGQPFEDSKQDQSIFERLRRRRRVDRFLYDDSILLYRHLSVHEREHGTRITVQAVAEVDSAWGVLSRNNSSDTHQVLPPQSHLARSRTDESWMAKHAGSVIAYEGVAMSEPISIVVPPLSGWLVWRDMAFLSIILCMLPPSILAICFRKGLRMPSGPSSRSLARLRMRQLRKAHGWLRNSSKREIVKDIAEIQRLTRSRNVEAP